MNRHALTAAIAALLLLPLSAIAADNADAALDDVIVTANRTAVTADAELASVSVITRADIERLQARSVEDVLRGLPGVSLANNGGPGKSTSLFLRGTESDHTLVMIDGIKMGSATSGGTALQDLPIEMIERIEVVRGPRSSLYGSEAIGGVVQIFTRRASAPLETHFSAGIGSRDTRNLAAGIGMKSDKAWLNANLAYADTDGINSCRGAGDPVFAGCFTNEPDRDPYRNQSVNLRGGVHIGDRVEADGHLLRANGHNFYDGSFVDESKIRQEAASASLRMQIGDGLSLHTSIASSADESDNYKDGQFMSFFNTRRNQATVQGDVNLSERHRFTAGVDLQNDKVDSDTPYDETARRDRGVFAEYIGHYGPQNLQLSARNDKNQQFGSHSTGAVGWGYTFDPQLAFNVSYGNAFKSPNFNDLYYPGFSNPDLRPERSRSVEFGLRGRDDAVRWSAQAFQTVVTDLIAFDADTFAPGNVDRARIRGLEGTLGLDLLGWNLDTSVTALQPNNDSGGLAQGKQLPRRPRASARIDLDRDFGAWRTGLTAFGQGKRYDNVANTRQLGGYTTLDLRVDYAFATDWSLRGRVENALDKGYETAAYFNQPGRGYFLTLRYQPAR